jgi:uncharacterized protein YciI
MNQPPEAVQKLQALLANTVSRTLFVCTATAVDAENRWPPPPDLVLAHVQLMKGLEADGRLFTSGPFLDEVGERTADGLFILDVPEREAAEELIASDPFVREGYRTVALRAWQLNTTKAQ